MNFVRSLLRVCLPIARPFPHDLLRAGRPRCKAQPQLITILHGGLPTR
ncbi:MAG: hypothetical protein ACREP9_22715 [Candidatus Dormibacteraceae bacterium]